MEVTKTDTEGVDASGRSDSSLTGLSQLVCSPTPIQISDISQSLLNVSNVGGVSDVQSSDQSLSTADAVAKGDTASSSQTVIELAENAAAAEPDGPVTEPDKSLEPQSFPEGPAESVKSVANGIICW